VPAETERAFPTSNSQLPWAPPRECRPACRQFPPGIQELTQRQEVCIITLSLRAPMLENGKRSKLAWTQLQLVGRKGIVCLNVGEREGISVFTPPAGSLGDWKFEHAARNGPAEPGAELPEQLPESELFGYERGAFTGAQQAKPGQIELAAGGVLFLDEVSEMSLTAQANVLASACRMQGEQIEGCSATRHVRLRKHHLS